MAGNGDKTGAFAGKQVSFLVNCEVGAVRELVRPFDSLVELCVTLDARYGYLVLKRKVAVVLDLKGLKVVCTVGLPENLLVLCSRSLLPCESASLEGNAFLVEQFNIKGT